MKIYTKEVMRCEACPHYECRNSEYSIAACWAFETEDFDFKLLPKCAVLRGKVPAWCPLKNKAE